MSMIVAIGDAVPAFEHKQKDIAQYMINYLELNNNDSRKLKAIYNSSAIEKRYSVIPDFSSDSKDGLFFSSGGKKISPSVEDRLECFQQKAAPLANEAINAAFKKLNSKALSINKITHLITVSCTGMSAPGLEIEIINNLNISPNVSRIGINFMGCYAVFHALKIADAICKADENAIVAIVSVELCTIHFQNKPDDDNLISNSLFSDGAASVIVTSDEMSKKHSLKGYYLKSFFSDIAAEGKKDMAWQISSSGFLMTLSSFIPKLVEKEIAPLAEKALANGTSEKMPIDFYAIHPGGKKILEAAAKSLFIYNGKMEASCDVLRNFGNMSSATILFVLKELWEKKIDWEKEQNIFAAGFGPGLSLESAVLTTVNHS
jgi:predicted naringenin-chalcone synthase